MTRPFEELTNLLALIHTGEWEKTAAAAAAVQGIGVPCRVDELTEYRRRLQEALLVARAARFSMADDLTRVRAATHFSAAYQTGTDFPERSPGIVLSGMVV